MHLKLLTTVTILVFCFTSTALAFAQNDDKIVIFHTEFGHLAIELFSDDAPNTVENFLKLAESDFYDKTIFHRIIKGFMIQGGDPNTKESDKSVWGQGGPGYNLKAEFNSIKHDRGIVSMARSMHPDSASSQFFIVHDPSYHLDEQYTVFGRIITQESYDTLDKIATLQTTSDSKGYMTIPLELEKAEIKKTDIVTRSNLANILPLDAPERIESLAIKEISRYSNAEYGFSFMPQQGWALQEGGYESDSVVLVALGLDKDGGSPSIIFEVLESNDASFKEFLEPHLEKYHELDDGVTFDLLSEEYNKIGDGYNGLEITALQTAGSSDTMKFKQVFLEGTNFNYVISYASHQDYFDDGIVSFNNILDSFLITTYAVSDTSPENVIVLEDKDFNETEKGGCLIATATFGTEMAPQVQFLREIRDNVVLQTESGTSFMTGFNQFYYSFSPTIADYERENPIFKEAVKLAITPLLASLTLLQFADTGSESEMLGYGIGVILLNIGIYFAIPAAFIMKIRKLQ